MKNPIFTVIQMNENGVTLLHREQFSDAEKVFSNCIELNSDFLPAYYNRAVARQKQMSLIEAKKDIECFIDRTGDVSGYAVLGDILLLQDDYYGAEKCYTLCLNKSPLPALYFQRFLSRSFAGNYSSAYEDLLEAGRLGSKEAINLLRRMPGEHAQILRTHAAAMNA